MKKPLLLLAMVVLLGGCAQTYHGVRWTRPDFDQQVFNKDSYECERDARQTIPNNDLTWARDYGRFFERCMMSRGWTKVEDNPPPQPSNPQESPYVKPLQASPSPSQEQPSQQSQGASPSLKVPSPFDQIVVLVDNYGVEKPNNSNVRYVSKTVPPITVLAVVDTEKGKEQVSIRVYFLNDEEKRSVSVALPLKNLRPQIFRYKVNQMLETQVISMEEAGRLAVDFVNFWKSRDMKFISSFHQRL